MQLNTTKRDLNTKIGVILMEGRLPGVVFGKETQSLPLTFKKLDFQRVYEAAGESTVVDIQVEGEEGLRPVLISEIQHDPISGRSIHVAFHQIVLKEKVTVNVPVVFTGESPAVKSNIGVLLELLNEIEVEAYPRDLPKEFVVDVSNLAEVGQGIQVKDLKVDPKVEIKVDSEELVAKIDYLAVEEEAPAEVTEAEAVAGVKATEELSEEEKAKRAEEAKKKGDKEKE